MNDQICKTIALEAYYMISKSKDGKFDISEFKYSGMDVEKNCIGVSFRAKQGIPITLTDVANAIADCYYQYDVDNRKSAPDIYAVVILKDNRTFEFKVSWEIEDTDYLVTIARQIELQ